MSKKRTSGRRQLVIVCPRCNQERSVPMPDMGHGGCQTPLDSAVTISCNRCLAGGSDERLAVLEEIDPQEAAEHAS